MPQETEFAVLLERVRAADEAASREFVERFAPELERVVRVRFVEPLLQAAVDTQDICQSVLLDFFLRARLGQYEFAAPQDLLKLLVTMARHKLLNHVRRSKGARFVRVAEDHDPFAGLAAKADTPSAAATAADLLTRAAALLSEDERVIAEHRKAGRDWAEIAALTGESAESARKRLARACDRVCGRLGLLGDSP